MADSLASASEYNSRDKIAVLIPCYNEAATIGRVVGDFQRQCPEAEIYVCDNGSTDGTAQIAGEAGAIVQHERRRGKGYALRSMFRKIDADIYVIVDGDGTYPPQKVQDLIAPVAASEADMVIGTRLHPGSTSGFSALRLLGNKLFRFLVNMVFRIEVTDLLSGYRALSRRVVKSLPFLSHGFEIETELTVKCLVRGYSVHEVPVDLAPRSANSKSKIRIFHDGLLILETIFALLRDYKPLTAFGLLGMLLFVAALFPGVAVVKEYVLTGRILHTPSGILAAGLVLAGIFMIFMGFTLHTIARRFQELDNQIQTLIEQLIRTSRD